MLAPANTASKAAVNLLSRSRIKNRNCSARSPRSMSRLGLLGHPGPGGIGGDSGDVHAAAAVLDHDEDVEAAQEDGVDVGEVDGEDRVGLRGEELSPCRSGPSRGRIETGGLEDLPDGGGGDRVPESDELALNASVTPGWILLGHLEHQGSDGRWGGWSAWLSSWVGPVAGDEVGVPAQQRPGGDEPQSAQMRGQQPAQRAEDGAVDPGHGRAWVLSTQHGDLVAEHKDFDVLGCVAAGEQCQPAQQAGEQQVGESEGHSGRSCCAGC
jgi:hypothetical protein